MSYNSAFDGVSEGASVNGDLIEERDSSERQVSLAAIRELRDAVTRMEVERRDEDEPEPECKHQCEKYEEDYWPRDAETEIMAREDNREALRANAEKDDYRTMLQACLVGARFVLDADVSYLEIPVRRETWIAIETLMTEVTRSRERDTVILGD